MNDLTPIIQAAEEVADEYDEAHGAASGLEQTIYGEMGDAWRLFAEKLRERVKVETKGRERA